MKKGLTWLVVCTSSFSATLFAQDAVPLSLQDALNSALTNNKEIVMASLDEESAKAGFRERKEMEVVLLRVFPEY